MVKVNEKFGKLADDEQIRKTTAALNKKGIQTFVVASGAQAKKKVLELLPKGVEVMNMTSQTLEVTSLAQEVNQSGNFNSVRNQLNTMDRKTQGGQMQKLGAAPQWAIGSAHAVTEDGSILIASATGSQLPAYAYGSTHVIWVVGAQKLVKNLEEGLQRLYEYSFPLEDVRARKAYGVGSGVNKVLIVNKEVNPERLTLIIVKEKLGF